MRQTPKGSIHFVVVVDRVATKVSECHSVVSRVVYGVWAIPYATQYMEMSFSFCDDKTLQHYLFRSITYTFTGAVFWQQQRQRQHSVHKSKHNNSSEKCVFVCAYLRTVTCDTTRKEWTTLPKTPVLTKSNAYHSTFELFCRLRVSCAFITFIFFFLCILRSKLHKSECKRERKRHTQTDICVAHIHLHRRARQNAYVHRHKYGRVHFVKCRENFICLCRVNVLSTVFACVTRRLMRCLLSHVHRTTLDIWQPRKSVRVCGVGNSNLYFVFVFDEIRNVH